MGRHKTGPCKAIDNHLEFAEDDEGTRRMFARERRFRERFNRCMAADCAMPNGSYFDEIAQVFLP